MRVVISSRCMPYHTATDRASRARHKSRSTHQVGSFSPLSNFRHGIYRKISAVMNATKTTRIMEPSSTPKPEVNQIWNSASASARALAKGLIPSLVNEKAMSHSLEKFVPLYRNAHAIIVPAIIFLKKVEKSGIRFGKGPLLCPVFGHVHTGHVHCRTISASKAQFLTCSLVFQRSCIQNHCSGFSRMKPSMACV